MIYDFEIAEMIVKATEARYGSKSRVRFNEDGSFVVEIPFYRHEMPKFLDLEEANNAL